MARRRRAREDAERPAGRRKRSRGRRIARIAGIVLLVPVALVVLLLLVLHTGPGQRFVRDKIQERLADRIYGAVSIGELDFALFGGLALRKVAIRDEAGADVITLDAFEVEPDWSSLTGDSPTVDRIALSGLRLHLVQDAEGKLNLKALLKPQPPEPPKEEDKEPEEPKKRRILVRQIQIADIDLTLDKADGTSVALQRFGLEGTADVTPATKTFRVKLPRIVAGLSLDKKQDGLRLAVTDFRTGIEIDLADGAGNVALLPTHAHAKLEQKGAPLRETDLDLGGIRVEIAPDKLGAAIDKLVVGAVALQSLEVRGGLAEGRMVGDQKVQLVGLRVDAAKVNELAAKELLASDVDVEVALSGPSDELALDALLRTGGGTVTIDGTVNLADRGQPRFDLTLTAADVAARRLLLLDKVPEASVHELKLGLRGCGSGREDARVDLGLSIDGIRVKEHSIDRVVLGAQYDDGRLRVDPLVVEAYAQQIMARGDLDLGTKQIDLGVTFEGDVGKTLDQLRKAGLKVTAQLPPGAIAYRRGVIDVRLAGDLEGRLNADVAIHELGAAGGWVTADVHAALDRNADPPPGAPAVKLAGVEGTVELRNVGLKQALALRGKKLDGLTGTVSGTVEIGGEPEAPEADFRLEARVQPHDGMGLELYSPTVVATVVGKASKTEATAKVAVVGEHADKKAQLLSADVFAPLVLTADQKGLAQHRPLNVKLDIPERSIAELLPYLPARLKTDAKTGKARELPEGTIEAHVDIGGTAARPTGDIDIDLRVAALAGGSQRLKLDGKIESAGGKVIAGTELQAWLNTGQGPVLDGTARVELSRSPLVPGPKQVSWAVKLDVPQQDLGALPIAEAQALGVAGKASASIDLRGNQSDLYGSVGIDLDDVVVTGKGPLSGKLAVKIEPKGIELDTDLALDGSPVLRTRGGIARSGKGLLAALRDKRPGVTTVDKLGNPAIDLDVEVPRHRMSTYRSINPKVASLPGTLGGAIDVGGDLTTPTAEGGLSYEDFETLDGSKGRVAIGLEASQSKLGAAIGIGRGGSSEAAPVSIEVGVSRPALKPYLAAKRCYGVAQETLAPGEELLPGECPEDATLPIEARIAASDVDLRSLVPDFALSGTEVKIEGNLSWSLDGKVILDPQPRYAEVSGERVKLLPIAPESTLDGELRLDRGAANIPGTGRRIHGVELALGYTPDGIDIKAISARESDLQRKDRKIDVTGRLSLERWLPSHVELKIDTDEWLVHGGDRYGEVDAPRGTLTAAIRAKGKLDQPIKKIDVTVDELAFLVPDRFRRAHEPEHLSLGDVIYLDETLQPPGKLPVSAKALEEDAKDPFAEEQASNEAAQAAPESGLDVHVDIPNDIHLLMFPMDLFGHGGIDVSRRGDKTMVNGKITMVDGFLALGGRKHKLRKGHFLFNDDYPGGFLELWFARREHNATLRDISEASGGQVVKIHMKGPLNKRKTTLHGAGSPGTLYDLLSVHNAGRQRFLAQPDMPASITVEYPQHPNLLLLSYLATNVPHMLFLDKVAAWSDAYDGRGTTAYGEVRHLEAEGYNESGSLRVRAEVRERGAGQSASELGLDWLWVNTPQTAVGVGVNAGSRLGGGPGLFFEWSSKD
ncbi:MAG: translocation/assembly module TamB domain-containing protein [Deltaproteobacteria bacterium]|jgi:hypothetical protein|nr:translocation/assembly module TamB domain-containing protein [Deltaproteobacteria bacterium]MBW2537669.1 translocation/assembly module TamB domain-containing protein [Deltaproteobacteria bacterium]